MPSFWAFTFAWSAVAFSTIFWLGVSRPTGWRAESYVVLALISVFVGAIGARTVLALWRKQFLPTQGAAAATAPVPSVVS
jgi:tellurite resistance protein